MSAATCKCGGRADAGDPMGQEPCCSKVTRAKLRLSATAYQAMLLQGTPAAHKELERMMIERHGESTWNQAVVDAHEYLQDAKRWQPRPKLAPGQFIVRAWGRGGEGETVRDIITTHADLPKLMADRAYVRIELPGAGR